MSNLSKEAQKSLTEVFPGQQRDLFDMGLLLGLLLVGDSNWSHYFSHYPKPQSPYPYVRIGTLIDQSSLRF